MGFLPELVEWRLIMTLRVQKVFTEVESIDSLVNAYLVAGP